MATKPKFDISKTATVGKLLEKETLTSAGTSQRIRMLPSEKIHPLKRNTDIYDEDELAALAKDISEDGIQQPLNVYPDPEQEDAYLIIAGNRRYRAAMLAQEQYNYDASRLPCIVQEAPKENWKRDKRLIKNNLNRTKKGYTRVREIAVYKKCVEDELAATGRAGTENVYDIVCDDLGVSQNMVTRFCKIDSSLSSELMEFFHQELMSEDVAYHLARQSDDAQRYVLEKWDHTQVLTRAALECLIAEYECPEEMKQKPQKTRQKKTLPQINSVHEGILKITDTCGEIRDMMDAFTLNDDKKEKKIIGKIAAEMARLEALKLELSALKTASETQDA